MSCLLWHPIHALLCVGWENGDIYVYDRTQNRCVRVDTLHNSAIVLMRWSAAGSRLITADKMGSVIGWRVEAGNQVRPPVLEVIKLFFVGNLGFPKIKKWKKVCSDV